MSTYEISKSSLLSLKAEILRKQEELSKTRTENEIKIKNIKKNSPLEIKNKGLENREKNDISEEDEDLLKRSRERLEAKSRLYDKLSKNTKNLSEEELEHNRRYLVRFDRKASKVPDLPPEETEDDYDRYPSDEEDRDFGSNDYEPAKNRDEEWVEYVDCLGRTRTCLRKDLDYLKSKDKDLKLIVDEKRRNRGESPPRREPSPPLEPLEPEITEESELLSNDMRRELLRKQWEKEEDELRNKSDIHYQDILFNEARSHGVGYYGFSKDEEERKKQQDALKKLRDETERQQKRAQELKAMREKQLKARVKAAKDRKRARLGLPPEEEEPEPVPEPEPPKEEPKVEDPAERRRRELRERHIRPWDIGKEGVKEHYEYTQEEWVEKQRKERLNEFAPPSFYSPYEKERKEKKQKERRRSRSEERPKESSKSEKMEPVPIVNECSISEEEEEDNLMKDFKVIQGTKKREVIKEKRGKGAEIAPPPTYDYYGPPPTKQKKAESSSNVGQSIEAGLKFLRNQVEQKKASKHDHSSEDLFLI